ncbi:adenosine deaminase [Pontibacterium granulatum]|uniref:adenosine deaminase n=1 Tax=Pontibacterium granulatum TaxID=2036029 RepID=UPI00249CA0E3|nr:adenosine deaminase [Pontibacterium granulatum]MDI3324872.1 adenosine deaminase [Pontibacterium granulatum]
MKQHTQIEVHLLNAGGLLCYLETLSFSEPVDRSTVEHELFMSFHQANQYQPDHILTNKLHELDEYAFRSQLAFGPVLATKRLVDQYFEEGTECRIKLPLFGYWQNLMARISSLPLQAAFYASRNFSASVSAQYSWPLYPYHPSVEDYISRQQLNESHQHLNGSSNAESCWLDALRKPELTTAKFREEYQKKPKLRQLCAQISPELTPDVLLRRLELAMYLRQLLARMVCTREKNDSNLNFEFLKNEESFSIPLMSCSPQDLTEYRKDMSQFFVRWPTSTPYSDEAEFNLMQELLNSLQRNPNQNPLAERLLWIYLLIQNQYLTLLVQRDDFYGFDQFQKYTFTELRDITEQEYLARFRQAHGSGKVSQTGYLEGRFAPKKDMASFERILCTILGGYARYLSLGGISEESTLTKVIAALQEAPHMADKAKLALVVHFIKRPYIKGELFPFHDLYRQLTQQASLLIRILKANPGVARWVRGVDAAANEMDTPPEVFAPLFRVLKAQGIRHVTYHVGEDFSHLVSGIRAIDDAIRFLPLNNGDRLGHCTAIGILPSIWRRSLPPTLTVTQENHLLDLIFVWRAMRHNHAMFKWASFAASEAVALAQKIFRDPQFFCIEQLDELFTLRDLYPLYDPLRDEARWQLRAASVWDTEYERVDKLLSSPEKSGLLKLYRRWLFDDDVRKQRYTMHAISTDWLPDDALIALQQTVMKGIAGKNLAIECPPSSNTRISQYVEVQEHHVFRWMGVDAHVVEGDVPMSICLASDDPGIFVTDIKAEFYHLFAVLTQQMKLSPHEALSYVSTLNENGRIFRFHNS